MPGGPRFISLLTLSSLAALICTLHSTVPGANALSIDTHGIRSTNAHEAIALKKRNATGGNNNAKRCKPRPAPSSAAGAPASSAPASQPAPSKAAPPPPASSKPASQSSSSGSSSSSSKGSSSSSGSSSGGGNVHIGGSSKAGLGWPNGNQDLDKWQGISTIYTWNPSCPSDSGSLGITCCPMLWGWDQVGQWQSEVMNTSPSCVMGMNEPEISGQSNMDPGSGVQLWNQYIRPMKAKGATLISPATTSDPAGKQWMQSFFNECGGNKCDVDILAVHWYDVSGDALISYLEDLHNTFQLPMWLTEFACQNFNNGPQCSEQQVQAFQQQVTSFMESTSYILKYMPFGAMHDMQGVNPDNQLMNSDGSPNALAKAYFPSLN